MADLLRPENYEPREQWSPSGFGLSDLCELAWFRRYVLGVKENDLATWPMVEHLERPKAPPKGAPAVAVAAHREDTKEYNRLTRRALGHAVHDVLACHYDWHPPLQLVDWLSRPGAVALAGMPYLPAIEECAEVYVEQELSQKWGPDSDPITVRGFADLLVRMHSVVKLSDVEVYEPGEWVLIDYKTTYNFTWVPLAEELLTDIAANFYALETMVKLGLSELRCRWVYFLTDETKTEDARKVDFTITRDGAIAVLQPYEGQAERLREIMRAHVLLKANGIAPTFKGTLAPKPNPVSCSNMFGSHCPQHHSQGGDCRPREPTKGELLIELTTKRRMLEKRRQHNNAEPKGPRKRRSHIPERLRNRQGAEPRRQTKAAPPGLTLSARHVTPETATNNRRNTDTMGKFDTEAQAAGAPPAAGAAAPKVRAPRAPKPAAPAASTEQAPPLYLTAGDGGQLVPLIPGTPMHTRALAYLEAVYAE